MKDYNDLIKRFPLLFQHQEGSQEPFALFGFECSIGWYDIIEKACETIYSSYRYNSSRVTEFKYDLDNIDETVKKRQSWDKDKTREWIITNTQNFYDTSVKDLEVSKLELPKFVQIKEKFGSLRLYHDGGNKFSAGVIQYAELLSTVVCEVCGNSGQTYHIGWNRTLCKQHAQERYGAQATDPTKR